MEADTLIADKAFDADARVLEPLAAADKTAVIPPRTNRSSPREYDRELYAARHLIENFFAKIKQFRAIATRYEKTARNFLAAVQLVASVIWLGRDDQYGLGRDDQYGLAALGVTQTVMRPQRFAAVGPGSLAW
jgi:transposase